MRNDFKNSKNAGVSYSEKFKTWIIKFNIYKLGEEFLQCLATFSISSKIKS